MAEREHSEEYRQLEQTIAQLEVQRAILGDAVVDASIAALRDKLATLEPATVSEQRKQATVLFADVAGFTAMSETMDPEEVSDVMNTLWQRIDAAIVEHGGHIDKHIGDAVMALWGVDVAHETDPEYAMRAALAMQAVLADFGARHAIAMRIGLSTGPVLLRRMGNTGEFSAIGDAVDLAQQLEEAAPTGGVLISHPTYRHVRGVFDILEQAPIQVKGKAEPIQAYLVQQATLRIFRMSTRGVAGIETRMVGRDAELLMLQNMFRNAVASLPEDAEAHVVTIVGDAGVGKSRLLYEFEKWIDLQPEKVLYFKGRATWETQAVPYGLIRHMFAYRFEILESDSAAAVWTKFRAGMAGTLDSDQADLVGQLIGFDFSASPAVQTQLGSKSFGEAATVHLTEYLRATASNPMVILLEDIHWADDSSLDLLDRLIAAAPDTRLLVVCLARPPLFERRPSWGEGRENHTRINLKPLSRRASRALVGEILKKARDIPGELRDLIVEGAEGNPFYVEELITMLIEDGVIVPGEENWRVELARLAKVRVPSTLIGVLQARLDSLPFKERILLQRASVVGRLFWGAVVAELASDQIQATQVDKLLDDARDRELIFRRENSAFAWTQEYVFRHALLRDVIYETVLLKLRRVHHSQVAQWLEHAAGERISEHLSLIAGHYELAGETAKAINFWRRSGEESLKVSAFRDAVRAFERALALLPDASHDQLRGTLPHADLAEWGMLLIKLGSSYNWVGNYPAATQHLEQALALAREINDPQMEIAALNELAQVASAQGTYDTAQNYLDEVLALAREQDDLVCVASTLARLGTNAWKWGNIEQAEKCASESLTIYRELGDQHRISLMLNILGILATLQKNYDQAEQYYEQGLKMAREIDDRQLVADLLNNLGYLGHHCTGNLEKAKRCYQESLLIAQEIGHRSGATSTLNNLGQLYILLGDHQSAWKYLREALIESVAIGAVPLTLEALVGVVQQQIAAGQYLSAAGLLGLALNHPALETDVRQVAESALGRLHEVLPTEQLEVAMERGKVMELDAVVAELQAVIGERL